MSAKPKPAAKQPLTGVRVLVGRARHQAGVLSGELRRLGAQVLEIPFIEIRRPRSFRPLDSVLESLDSYDWLILTSVNGVEAMWQRLEKLRIPVRKRGGHGSAGRGKSEKIEAALASERQLRIAAIGPATKKAIEHRGLKVDVMPKEYVAESVVRSLRRRVRGKSVLLVRAKVARDVIPCELRKAGAHVDVVEAYETVVPQSSRRRLQAVLKDPSKRPGIVTFTSSSTVKNFMALLNKGPQPKLLGGIQTASIGPVTSATLREVQLPVDIEARVFTIAGLVSAIVDVITSRRSPH
jgi:uroporphyrinogen-III synthase